VIALGLGSSGHIAIICLTAWNSAGVRRLEQAQVMGLSPYGKVRVVGREVLPLVLGPLGARLVLHNTGFAALFPVAEVLGGVVEASNETFAVAKFAALGAVAYIAMSQAIWTTTRTLEARLRAPGSTHAGHVEVSSSR
jgi:ABC-type amino acid transport system permease subunit